MISIRLVTTPTAIEPGKVPGLIRAIVDKMNELMFRTQAHIVGENIPQFFPNGAPNIAATIRAIPAVLEGNKITGAVEAGGPRTTKITLKSGAEVDYSAVQEEGVSHSYEILPFNKKALAFMISGNKVIVRKVIHPGLRARPYMLAGLQDMKDTIIFELSATFAEMLS